MRIVPSIGAASTAKRAFTVPSRLVYPVSAGRNARTATPRRSSPTRMRTKRLLKIIIG